MAIVWSVVFVNALGSMAGIGVGICLGTAFGLVFASIFRRNDKKDK